MRRSSAALLAAALLTSGCGYIGGPVVPLANVPTPVTDLAALQLGGQLIVHFTAPVRTTENVLISKPLTFDLRVGTAGAPFDAEQWAGQAKRIGAIRMDHGIATAEISAADWTGRETIFGVRAVGANGKSSAWSNWAVIPVVPPPQVPADVKVENVPAGLRVTWTAQGKRFRVLRGSGPDGPFSIAATADQPEWTDTAIEYGKPYSYMVQTLTDIGDGKTAESDLSHPTAPLIPRDVFPPAVPAGLRALEAPGSIELSWERNTEPDLELYRVYRATGDGPYGKIAETNVPSYSDATAQRSSQYRYAVSAVDQSGNESARSAPVSGALH